MLLGGWLGDGLASWGKVRTHLDQVSPFWGAKCLDGGASRATAAARSVGRLVDARLIKHRHCLGCFFCRCPFHVAVRAIGSTGGDECGCLGDAVLLAIVGLLEAALDGDDPSGWAS
jgi:hypothetical protein